MKPLIYGLHFNNLRGDLYGGLVAKVVALPLALAFGITSGTGAIAGLYEAIHPCPAGIAFHCHPPSPASSRTAS